MTDPLEAYRLLMADVYELAGLSRRTSERDASILGSSVARWHALSVVSEQPLTVPAIAERLGLVRQSVQRVVDDLVADGQLARRENPAHRRSALYTLTPAGCTTLSHLWTRSAPGRKAMLRSVDVDAAELLTARATLRRLVEALRKAG